MQIILLNILTLVITIFFLILLYLKQNNCNKLSNELVNILEKNIKFIDEFSKKQEIIQLKNTINIYSKFQVILKISKADYISFFKYDYSKRFIVLHFIISVDEKGYIIHKSALDDLPISSNLLTLNIIQSKDKDLYTLNIDELDCKNHTAYDMMCRKGINKIYYQNIFKNKENPFGFIVLSYKDKNFKLPDSDKTEVLRIIEQIKSYL
jgi:hypothetical protein